MTEKTEDDFDDFDFGNGIEDEVTVNMQDTYIEMHHKMGSETLTLIYDGRSEEIHLSHHYTQQKFISLYPHLDGRAICSIASVFIDLRYYGYDFYSGDFEATLKRWLEEYVFLYPIRDNYHMVQYLLEKETKALFRDLSNFRLPKSSLERDEHKFTPLTWASPEEIKKLYDRHKSYGHYE